MATPDLSKPAGASASSAPAPWRARPASWGLLRHPLLWRQSLTDTVIVAALLYSVAALLPHMAPNRATELWTLGQMEIARTSASLMAFIVAALLLKRQLNYPLGDQPWRVHAAVWAMNVGIACVLLGAGVVYKLMLDRHLAQAVPAAQVQRMNELHGNYGYWTCQDEVDEEALQTHGETLKEDLEVFGLRTDLTVTYGAAEVCDGGGRQLVVMTRTFAKARPVYEAVERRGEVDVDNLLFRGRLECLAQTHQRLSQPKGELVSSLLYMLVQAGLIACLLGAAGVHPPQRARWRLLRHWPAWCRLPREGSLARFSGLGRFERWLLLRAPWVWALAPHRILLGLIVAAAITLLAAGREQPMIYVALANAVCLISIVRQSRYKLQATSLFLWPAYAAMVLVICLPAMFWLLAEAPLYKDMGMLLIVSIIFVCLPFTAAAALAQALEPIWAAAAWVTGMVGTVFLLGSQFVNESTLFFGWAAVAGLVCAALMLGQSRRVWLHWMAVAVLASSSGAGLAGVEGLRALSMNWSQNERGAMSILIVMLAAAASVLVLNRKWRQPCSE